MTHFLQHKSLGDREIVRQQRIERAEALVLAYTARGIRGPGNTPFHNTPSDKTPFHDTSSDKTPFHNKPSDDTPYHNTPSNNTPSHNPPS